ncbi:DegT/DnrJ/EryC1/StrS family aminotransferase [Salinimicrobium sp. HB62]|uniref:DegT/DnrJ/EryC1/StrS family aminotransferase n=1 Tax=Salinimicrobium sp. HB62 TaxID=3077781 RepID=UPI002D78964F|nr:DegT/DnrJ/EryC1/StrS family aminotransferase [Salinimicrobium sp. HB62]
MIPVTKSFLPPQKEYQTILKRAWDQGWITNRGMLVKELEEKLKAYLEVPNMIATTNGTLPLQIAIKALGLKGEIITTPFSYVATTSSIVWENCTPVFVDIHPDYLTIDEGKIEAAITPKTSAILATHVFGNPCDVEKIEMVAKKHKLKVIYDAAHCFGVKYKGRSIFEYGDISTCSFHATKLFHTGEGGAIFTRDIDLHHKLFYHHNFGHKGQEDFYGLGINAKMSELQAAMGLAVFPYLEEIIDGRRKAVELYNELLSTSGPKIIKLREETSWNYSYYPLIFESEKQLVNIKEKLDKSGIHPRRYFYPSLSSLNYLKSQEVPVANSISKRIICLPLYHNLGKRDLKRICSILN